MPFLLRQFLTIFHIKDVELASLRDWLIDLTKVHPRIPTPAQVVNAIISCWVAVAKASYLSFSFTFTEQSYKELEKALRTEHEILLKVWNMKYLFY